MSDTVRPPREDSCELPPVTCWPLIFGLCGFLLLGVLLTGGLFVYDGLRPPLPVAEAAPPKAKPAPNTSR